jgi:TonB family protein
MRLIVRWGLSTCAAATAACYHPSAHQPATPPHIVSATPTPAFPAALQRANVEGNVELVIAVDSSGRLDPASTHVVRSTHELFRLAAISAIERWRFEPARREGRAAADSVRVRWRFALDDRDCPPPAFPPSRCGESVSDSAATGAPQRSALEPSDGNLLAGRTVACPVAVEATECVPLARH